MNIDGEMLVRHSASVNKKLTKSHIINVGSDLTSREEGFASAFNQVVRVLIEWRQCAAGLLLQSRRPDPVDPSP